MHILQSICKLRSLLQTPFQSVYTKRQKKKKESSGEITKFRHLLLVGCVTFCRPFYREREQQQRRA